MYQPLGDVKLKTGETVEIALVTAPSDEYAERLHDLLGHKGEEWVWQVDQAFEGKTDELENRFYVARRGDDLISNTCTFENAGVGILGHVWTPPAERRKGLASTILEKVMDDFRSRGGGLMLLSTRYDSPPWHMYRKLGFVAYHERSGCMRYGTDDDFEAKYFAAGPTRIVEPSWGAWPKVNALIAQPEEFVKSIAYGKFGKTFAEDSWICLMRDLAAGKPICAKLLESRTTGAAVGYAWVLPDERFPGVFLLDLYCQVNHTADYGRLLEAVRWPEAKVQCYVEAGLDEKVFALEAAGFEREVTLRGQLAKRDMFADVLVTSRRGKS